MQNESTRAPIESSPVRDEVEEALITQWAYLIWNAHGEDQFQYQGIEDKLRKFAAHIRTQERERAAKIADDRADKLYDVEGYGILAKRIAAAIREQK